MLFTFNYFWKFTLVLLGSWIMYGLGGFEFTMITIMACILASNLKE